MFFHPGDPIHTAIGLRHACMRLFRIVNLTSWDPTVIDRLVAGWYGDFYPEEHGKIKESKANCLRFAAPAEVP